MVMANAKVACMHAALHDEQKTNGEQGSLSENRCGEPGTPDVSSDAVGIVLHRLLACW